jgi:hypothetical protein
MDLMIDRTTPKPRWQLSPQTFADGPAVTSLVPLVQEEQNPRLPVVIGRHLVVEGEHLGPATE